MSNSDDFKTGQGSTQRGAAIHSLQMTLLKRSRSRFSETDARLWSSFLSTILGQLSVTQGRLAIAHDSFSRLARSRSIPPSTKIADQMDLYCTNLLEALSEIQEMGEVFSDLREAFDRKTGPYAS